MTTAGRHLPLDDCSISAYKMYYVNYTTWISVEKVPIAPSVQPITHCHSVNYARYIILIDT